LIILTICAAMGAYDLGIFIVALWTIISTIILTIRLFAAYGVKKKQGQLTSWLTQIDAEADIIKRIYRLFIYK